MRGRNRSAIESFVPTAFVALICGSLIGCGGAATEKSADDAATQAPPRQADTSNALATKPVPGNVTPQSTAPQSGSAIAGKQPQPSVNVQHGSTQSAAVLSPVPVYLDDMKEQSFYNKRNILGKHGSTKLPARSPQKVRMNGVVQSHALSLQATASGTSFVSYRLNGQYQTFQAFAGIFKPVKGDGLELCLQRKFKGVVGSQLTFKVIGDGRLLWSSKPMIRCGSWEKCEVGISGVDVLRLEIVCAGRNSFSFSSWVQPTMFKPRPAATGGVTVAGKARTGQQPGRSVPKSAQSTSGTSKPATLPPQVAQGKSKPKSVPAEKPVDTGTVRFEVLPTDELVTSMALSEDGRYLAMSHQADNHVSIWGVKERKLVKTLTTPSPRTMLFRGDKLIVANDEKGTISIFGRDTGWKLGNQVQIPSPHIVHISAARAKHFTGDLIVTCHGKGVEASYRRSRVYHVNLETDTARLISRAAVASVGYKGELVLTQESFNLSPSGGINAYAWKDFIAAAGAKPIFGGGVQQTPYVYQILPGPYWIAGHMVFAGQPLNLLKQNLGKTIVPDFSQRVIYAMTGTSMIGHRLNPQLTEVGRRKVEFPKPHQDFTRIYNNVDRMRGYLLDHPIAYTDGGVLNLFVIDIKSHVVLTASTAALAKPGIGGKLATTLPKASAPKNSSPSAGPGAGLPESTKLGVVARIAEGKTHSQRLAGAAGARYQLMSGPKGMKLSSQGTLSWLPGTRDVGTHELKIKVTANGEIAFHRPKIEVVSRELLKRSGGSLANVDQYTKLVLSADRYSLTFGLNHESLLLLQGETLKRLGPDGLSVVKKYDLGHRYVKVVERDDAFIGLSNIPKRLDVIDKKTLRVRKKIPLEPHGIRILDVMDVAVHPTRRLSYVSIKHDIQVPRYRVLVVNETSGKVEAPEDVIGTWVAVDPAGRYLYSGYKDIYERGSRFHVNPGGRVIRTPKYGSIDWLISYSLKGSTPVAKHVVTGAGGNGQGISLSADGKRITYLSHVGYPSFSGDLAGFNPADLKQPPVSYKVNAAAGPLMLAYHPTLKLFAVPGRKPGVLPATVFDRESGKPLPGKVLTTSTGLGKVKVERLLFSPDGRSLVFVCKDVEGRYLRTLPLKLTSAEMRRAAQKIDKPQAASAPRKNLMVVKRTDLGALKQAPQRGTDVTAKQIARDFMHSVVLIRSDEGTASGFVVGSRGYILTCAHAIPANGKMTVSYQTILKDRTRTRTAVAKLVRLDENRDLALLKIGTVGPLKPVTLAAKGKTEAGEKVTVIGNPGLGGKVLTHSLTTGVVSSPSRAIDGLDYIQTSAAVNPGNSGGPMFDSNGQVIGLVALKARIENTAFAVNVDALREFLMAASVAGK